MTKQYRNEDWLRQKYLEEGLTQTEIAEICGCCQWTIWNRLKKYNIPARDNLPQDRRYRDKDWLREKYLEEGISQRIIAELCNCSHKTIGYWMKKFNIPARDKYATGEDSHNWKGGFYTHPVTGYVVRRSDKKYLHRIVMEEHLGRELSDEEVVHHIDGNKQNNRIANLMLFKNKSEHTKYHYDRGDYNINQ